jgi:hypothetical protein
LPVLGGLNGVAASRSRPKDDDSTTPEWCGEAILRGSTVRDRRGTDRRPNAVDRRVMRFMKRVSGKPAHAERNGGPCSRRPVREQLKAVEFESDVGYRQCGALRSGRKAATLCEGETVRCSAPAIV